MTNRAVEIAGFLTQHGWDDAEQFPFAADFSPRRYARLVRSGGDYSAPANVGVSSKKVCSPTLAGVTAPGSATSMAGTTRAVLMDADESQKTPEFVGIATILRGAGLSAPEIYAEDAERGLVLMEDFGGRNIGAALDSGAEAKTIIHRALDVLVHLHGVMDAKAVHALDLPGFGGALFAAQVELFLDEYFSHVMGRDATHEEYEGFRLAWKTALRGIERLPQSLLLRDFMPDNLMDLPAREGVRGIGLLDFQDAGVGPIAYDIASLCEVVRRDGGDALLPDAIAYYHECAKPNLTLAELTTACHVLAAQRHMRILGIVAKQAKAGRREKLEYIPRIRAYLGELLKTPALMPVRIWAEELGVFG